MTMAETGRPCGMEGHSGPPQPELQPLNSLMNDGPGSVQDLLPVMARVLEAVAQAQHVQRRCDLDPRRILLQKDGGVQISPVPESTEDKTSVLGSLKYSCPELLQDDTSVSPALSHSYVLGFVFYELLLGRQLFEAQFSSVRQGEGGGWLVWHADRKRRATSLRQLRADVPVFVAEAIEKMMAKSPAERSADLESTAHLFARTSQSTAVYKALKDTGINGERPSDAAELPAGPRPWLIRLGEQPLWKALWRRVTPEDRRPGWASIQELERMLRQVEKTLRRSRSRVGSSAQKETARRHNPGRFSA